MGTGSMAVHEVSSNAMASASTISRTSYGRHERVLLEAIADVAFVDFEMRGVVARRRVAFFGQSYDRTAVGPLPAFLLPSRAKIAHWSGIDADAFAMALINEYRPGTPIGWHRDAPQYDIVAGISLLSACRMKFRPYRSS